MQCTETKLNTDSEASCFPIQSNFVTPRPIRPEGYCRRLRLSVCPSVRPSVCDALCNAITQKPLYGFQPNLHRICIPQDFKPDYIIGDLDLPFQGHLAILDLEF